MNDIKLLGLIAEGENSKIEFKREVDLSTAKNKAELIKDLIALANSADGTSYLIIGVDKNKLLTGITKLEEEQLQQVAATYITPVIQINCHEIAIQSPPFILGILEIRPSVKPHKASKTIEHVVQNKVFIRRGSVVAEASPEEVIRLHQESQINPEIRNYIRAAEIHTKLGNIDYAIKAYSEVLQTAPSAALFTARGDLYTIQYKKLEHSSEGGKWQQLAYKDYMDALSLSTSIEDIKALRAKRWHVFDTPSHLDYKQSDLLYQEELNWLKSNLSGRVLGEVLYINVKRIHDNNTFFGKEDATACLNHIIELGYDEADVYALRADAHYLDCNYGLALADIDQAILISKNDPEILAEYHYLRANILCKTQARNSLEQNKPFEQAFVSLSEAKRLYPKGSDSYGYIAFGFETEILYTYVLAHYTKKYPNDQKIAQFIIRQLVIWFGHINKKFPNIAHIITDIVGGDFWEANKSKFLT